MIKKPNRDESDARIYRTKPHEWHIVRLSLTRENSYKTEKQCSGHYRDTGHSS
jgi:hypothetical protein